MDFIPGLDLKVPVIRREAYTILYDRFGGRNYGHCDVHLPWTPRRDRLFEDDVQMLIWMLREPVYVLHPPGDRKHLRFITRHGFRTTGTNLGFYEVFVRKS